MPAPDNSVNNRLDNDPSGVRFFYKHLITSITLTALGIILIILLDTTFKYLKEHAYYIIFEHIATALIIAGIWHTIYQLLIWKEFIKISENITNDFIKQNNNNKEEFIKTVNTIKEEFIKTVNIAKRDAKLGLIDTYHDVSAFSFNDFILHPIELTIVLGQGYGWVTNNIESLRSRIQDPRKTTKFFFIHPDSQAAELVANKMLIDKEDYSRRAQATIQLIKKEMQSDSKVFIYGHRSVPHHAVYLGDRLVITPYFFSHEKNNPPVFVFEKGSFVAKVQKDLNRLEGESDILLTC